MSALARWFSHKGYRVAGYDKTYTTLTEALEAEGIIIHYDDSVDHIPLEVLENKPETLVVYTPAIPADHPGFEFLRKKGFNTKKRSEVLGLLTENMFTVAVAGTHGKTTTSSMLAHILKSSGRDCAAFLGGISNNYNSNLLINEKRNEDTVMVVEADEFDRSFLTLHPNIAVVTSADSDHLDIYQNKESLLESFRKFINQIVEGGTLFLHDALVIALKPEREDIKEVKYALKSGDYNVNNINIEKDSFLFDVNGPDQGHGNFNLHVPGYHNVENALAAIAVAINLNVQPHDIKKAIATYSGVKRRFEYVIRKNDLIYIDDYAHHPVEITAFLKSVKALYPGRKLTAVFQPHLYSRTRDFAMEFAESLGLADEIILMDIYPAREMPIEGVTSEIIFRGIKSSNKRFCKKEHLLSVMDKLDIEVLVTIGAGDIDKFVNPIKEILSKKK